MKNGANTPKEPGHKITALTIQEGISRALLNLRRSYTKKASQLTLSADNLPPSNDAIPTEIGVTSWLEIQHVDAAIRGWVQAQESLSNTVSVFPVFDSVETTKQAIEVITEVQRFDHPEEPLPEPSKIPGGYTQVLLLNSAIPEIKDRNTEIIYLVRNGKNVVAHYQDGGKWCNVRREIPGLNDLIANKTQWNDPSEIEKIALFFNCPSPQVRLERSEAELEARKKKQEDLRRKAQEVLFAKNYHADSFKHFIRACRRNDELWEGGAYPTLAKDRQWIIPVRINQNHYTVLVIHFMNEQQVSVKYYNSSGSDLAKDTFTAMAAYFQPHNKTINYQCVSKHDQKDGYNCGVFAFYNAIKIACENLNCENPLLKMLPNEALSDLTKAEYNEIFRRARLQIVDILKRVGHNVSATPDLLVEPFLAEHSILIGTQYLENKLVKLMEAHRQAPSEHTLKSIYKTERRRQKMEKRLEQVRARRRAEDDNIFVRIFDWLTTSSWQSLGAMGLAATLLYFFGLPYAMTEATAVFSSLSLSLPVNPFLSFLLPVLVFTMGVGGLYLIQECFFGDENSGDSLSTVPETASVPPQSEVRLEPSPSTFLPSQGATPAPTDVGADKPEAVNKQENPKTRSEKAATP
jgi:hypothetical protein